MSNIEGLGNLFNVVPLASGKHVSLANATGITFICYEDAGAQSITVKESLAGSGEQALGVLTHYYASNGIGGVWTRETSDANGALSDASSMVKKDTTAFDCAVFYIASEQLSEGFDSVEVTIDGAGICTAIVHDLNIMRTPANLTAAAV